MIADKKKVIWIGSFLFLAIFFAGYYHFFHRMPESSHRDAVVKVHIGNIGEYSILNLIAKENGYFKDNGLDATIAEYASGPPAMTDLLAGKVDIAIAADFVGARNIFINKDLRILASVDNHEDFEMIVRNVAKIATPTDLRGKKIGVTLGGAGEFFLGRFLSYNDVDAKDVTIINMTPDEITNGMEEGTIDACVIFNTYTYKIKQKMGTAVDAWSIQRTRRIFATAYSTATFIRNNPGVPEKYLRALAEAEDFLNGHPEESKAILARAMNYQNDYINYLWPKFNFGIGLSQEFLLALEDDARFILKNKLTDASDVPNYLDFTHFSALTAVRPSAVSIMH